ncbi:sulfotransferase domain-containing protein [Streptomyces sp. NPDC058620]|uniref:sulfotransferase domain-containing protein n=1 Tax=Streptomyces sp. NPDC058620 TaxID=3346560 RepID=UPI003648E576
MKAVNADGDVYVISFPKCGRTWLRVLMAKAVSTARGLPMELARNLNLEGFNEVDSAVPNIVFWHDDRVEYRTPAQLSPDKSFYHDRKVVLLVRDLRDTAVSRYFQCSRRPQDPYPGTIGDFLTEEQGSVRTCVAFWNIWYANRGVPASFLLTSYERLAADTAGELGRVLDFCGLPSVGEQILSGAADFASFANMRTMEDTDALQSERLRPAIPGDPDAYKTRRGVVGGYRDYLSDEHIDYVNALIRQDLTPQLRTAALAADHPRPSPSTRMSRPFPKAR